MAARTSHKLHMHMCRQKDEPVAHPVYKLFPVDDAIPVGIESLHSLVGCVYILGIYMAFTQKALAQVRRHFSLESAVEVEIEMAASIHV